MATETSQTTTEEKRAAYLMEAQTEAVKLFDEIEKSVVRPGVSEKELSDEIHALGAKRYNVKTHWHKRVIRSGPNTLLPYAENPPDRVLQPDDIVFVDLGPVFEAWEADFGRTFVLGDDPVKAKLRDTLEPLWKQVKSRFQSKPDITGEELYQIVCDLAQETGWEFGNVHAGHTVGQFPHERIPGDQVEYYITKGSKKPMRRTGKNGQLLHWILEIHLVDRARQIGGFYEQLLTVD